MQQHFYEHFCSSNHSCFISYFSVTFIGKTDPSDALKREDYWRSTLKPMASFGLNIEEMCEGLSFWYRRCVALGAVTLGLKKFF